MVKRSSFSIGKPICQCTILSSFSYYTSFCFFGFIIWVFICIKQTPIIDNYGCITSLQRHLKRYAIEHYTYVRKIGICHGWDVAFYISSFFKGKMLFTFIVLIGTRWSFLKLYLEDRKNEEFPWLEFQDHCRRSLEEWETRVG